MLRFRYQPTEEGFLALNRYALRRIVPPALYYFAGFLLCAFLCFPLVDYRRSALETYGNSLPALVLPGLVVFMFVATHVAAKRRWASAGEVRAALDYEIDQNGIRVTAASFNSFIQWQHIVAAEWGSGHYLLQTAQRQFYYFSGAVVPDRSRLVELLTEHVPRVRNLEKSLAAGS